MPRRPFNREFILVCVIAEVFWFIPAGIMCADMCAAMRAGMRHANPNVHPNDALFFAGWIIAAFAPVIGCVAHRVVPFKNAFAQAAAALAVFFASYLVGAIIAMHALR